MFETVQEVKLPAAPLTELRQAVWYFPYAKGIMHLSKGRT